MHAHRHQVEPYREQERGKSSEYEDGEGKLGTDCDDDIV